MLLANVTKMCFCDIITRLYSPQNERDYLKGKFKILRNDRLFLRRLFYE